MSNPLMGMMGGMPGGNGPFGMIQRMMGMMQNTQNPGAMLQNMAQSNPNIKKAMDMCQGRNPKDVFMEMYQQNGDQAHRDKLMESVGKLMVEVYDMLSSMVMDSDFAEERKEIQRQIKKLAEM